MDSLNSRTIGAATLRLQDALTGMSELPADSFDLAIVDPPYGASSQASWELEAGHGLPEFGGGWKLAGHEWDRLGGIDGFSFTVAWLDQLKRLVRSTGSIWIHSTYHNSGLVNVACQLLGLEILNEIVWFKRNAFPNLARRRLSASHETILWVHTGSSSKREYRFNYEALKAANYDGDGIKQAGKQLCTVWDIPNNKRRDELAFGRHQTQKPLRVTQRIVDVAGTPDGTAVIPFAGSGIEVIACLRGGMSVLGFEIDSESFDLSCRRVEAEVRGS